MSVSLIRHIEVSITFTELNEGDIQHHLGDPHTLIVWQKGASAHQENESVSRTIILSKQAAQDIPSIISPAKNEKMERKKKGLTKSFRLYVLRKKMAYGNS